jgi:cellulose biosynthesis protein BcsQ
MPRTNTTGWADSRDGQIVTFYSYKGGSGRTMALANVAWILAANGRRVLVADWDLESPGLHRFFHPFLDENEVRDASGIIDLIRSYERAATKISGPDEAERLIGEQARVQPHTLSLTWDFPDDGSLDFLSAGRQNLDYAATLAALDWDNFYERLNGGEFLDAVRADMKSHYDYVLIDSRTGLSDIAGICTIQLPDVLVDCFTFSTQGIEGAAQVARLIEERHRDRRIRVLPVPMRVDPAEKEKVEAGHATAVRLFSGLPSGMSEAQRREYWAAVEVPYRAFYAYEETLAIFGDPPGSPASLLSSFERLTAQITDGEVTSLPVIDEHVRIRAKQLFARTAPLAGAQVIAEFCPEDQVWGEWIANVLRAAGITVVERRLDEPDQPGAESARTLTVVSSTYLAQYRAEPTREVVPDLPVYITAIRPPAAFSSVPGAYLVGVPERDAVERLHRLLGITDRLTTEHARVHAARYPGLEPRVNTAPVHNVRFTGREDNLRRLREMFLDTTDQLPVGILGLGGIGKTQVALEYVHRFKTDYDLIWWMECGQPQFIESSLADLEARIRTDFDLGAQPAADVVEAARLVLQLLEQGRTGLRWLLIFDNAEDIGAIRPYLSAGGGDILITSRNRDWEDHARSMLVDVFSRAESVEHLRKRVPSIDAQEADEVAELLGDLPLAVATAGAWLAESGMSVSSYKLELERRAPIALSFSHLADYPQTVPETWALSLRLLQERSPAAVRLFELCSVMAPNIALELLHSPAMAKVLEPFDPDLAEPMVIGRLIKEIDRTVLIKIDRNSSQILIHRLVQMVVRDRMSPEQVAASRRAVNQVLAAARPSGGVDNPATWDRFRMLWPHLPYSQAVTSPEEEVRQLVIDRVRYMWHRRDLDRAVQAALEADFAWERMLATGSDAGQADQAVPLRRQLLQLRFNRANILRDLARFAEARALDEQVLAEQRELLGVSHPHTLMTAGGLAADLRALGEYYAALEMDKVTYPSWTELYGTGNARALAAANNLAVSYRATGDFAAAMRLDEDTYSRRRASLDAKHPQTLNSAANLVRDLLEAGQYREAVVRADALLQDCADALGADAIATLNAEALLGIALRSAGQPQQAEGHLNIAYEGFARRLGGSSSDALACRLGHAVALVAMERAAEAEAEIRDVLSVYQERLGSSHPHTLLCLIDLSCALRTLGRFVEASQLLQPAIDDLRDVLGEDHPYALAALVVRGVLLADQGELEQAEQVESAVVDRLTVSCGAGHPDTMRSRANLLLTRKQLGTKGAAAELDKVIDELSVLLGPNHPDVRTLRREGRLLHVLHPQPF